MSEGLGSHRKQKVHTFINTTKEGIHIMTSVNVVHDISLFECFTRLHGSKKIRLLNILQTEFDSNRTHTVILYGLGVGFEVGVSAEDAAISR